VRGLKQVKILMVKGLIKKPVRKPCWRCKYNIKMNMRGGNKNITVNKKQIEKKGRWEKWGAYLSEFEVALIITSEYQNVVYAGAT
jgi:hypothetical protein